MKTYESYGPSSLFGTLNAEPFYDTTLRRWRVAERYDLGKAFSVQATATKYDEPGYQRPKPVTQKGKHQAALRSRVLSYVRNHPGCSTKMIVEALDSRFEAVMKAYYDEPNLYKIRVGMALDGNGAVRKCKYWEVAE